MSSYTRTKGSAAETAVVKYLNEEIWPAAERRRLAGSSDKGDINPGGYPVPPVVIEVKNQKSLNFSGWLKEAEEERKNANAEIGLVWAKRAGKGKPEDWYVVMDGKTAVELLRKAGYSYGGKEEHQ